MVTMSDLRTEARDLFRRNRSFDPRPGLSIQLEMSFETLQELVSGRLDMVEIVGDDAYQDRAEDRAILYLYLDRKEVA